MSASSLNATETCRNWNEVFPIGTQVLFEGRVVKTESHAALGQKFEPGVFIEGVQELVPLRRLEVPGWEMAAGKRKKRG